MSKVVRPIARIGGAVLGIAGSLIGGPLGLLGIGAGIGLSLLGSSKKSQPQFQFPTISPAPPPLSQTVQATISPRVRAYGRVRQAGKEFVKENNSTKAYLLQGLYLNDGPIAGIDAVIVDDEFVPLQSAETLIPSDPVNFPLNVLVPNAGSKYISITMGNVATAVLVAIEPVNATRDGYHSFLLGDFTPQLDSTFTGIWDASHLGKGVTVVYTWSNANAANGDRLKFFPNAFPQFSFIYRASPVYDPRDPTQTFTGYDPYNATWKWSENPALVAADYVNWLISERLTAIRGVNWASIVEAANDCDRLVPALRASFANGNPMTERFATISALITLDMEPREVLAKIMESCDADYGVDQNGLFYMDVGKWREPEVTFTGAEIGDFEEDFVPSLNEEVNYMQVSYLEPRQNHQRVHAPIYRDTRSEAAIGRRTGSMQLDWVTSASQAWRLAARRVKRVNGKRVITASLGAKAMTALRQRVVRLDMPERGVYGVFEILSLRPDGSLANWVGNFREVTADIFEDTAPPNDTVINFPIVSQPALTAPTNLLASAISTGSGVGVAQLSLDANLNTPNQALPNVNASSLMTDPTLQLNGAFSTDGGVTSTAMTTMISHLVLQTPELPSGTNVTMWARWVSNNGAASALSAQITVTIP